MQKTYLTQHISPTKSTIYSRIQARVPVFQKGLFWTLLKNDFYIFKGTAPLIKV